MAPEQFLHATVNAQTDIYSLGITLYQMLSGGESPYKGDSAEGSTPQDRYAWEHINKPLPPLQDYNPSLPKNIIAAVEKALDKDPRRRFNTAMQLWGAFERARSGKSAGSGEQTVLWQSRAPSKPIRQPSMTSKPPPSPPPKPGTLHLFCRSGEWAGRSIIIPKQGLTIGRGKNNLLRMQERSVSRQHATILAMRSGIYIRDEGSALGTFVNGKRIAANVPMPLKHGDVIQTGYYQVFELRLK
jgi:serine/threonine protein kinase